MTSIPTLESRPRNPKKFQVRLQPRKHAFRSSLLLDDCVIKLVSVNTDADSKPRGEWMHPHLKAWI